MTQEKTTRWGLLKQWKYVYHAEMQPQLRDPETPVVFKLALVLLAIPITFVVAIAMGVLHPNATYEDYGDYE